MTIKEQFYQMIADAGFKGLRDFSRACGVGPGNIYSNVAGMYELSLKRAFVFANTLRVPVMDVIAVFYPDEVHENFELAN